MLTDENYKDILRPEMEENQTTENFGQQVNTPAPSVNEIGFPSAQQSSQGGSKKWIFVILGVLLLAVGGIFFLSKRSSTLEATPSSEVSGESVESTPSELATPESSSTPTATPVPSSDKSKIDVQVQNGTGITGEAAYLQTQLKNLGYTSIKVGNASSTGVTATTVTFAKTVPGTIVDEITAKLQDIYQSVTTKTVTTSTYDVVVVTGLRKGATSKPVATPTATP